MFSKTLEWAFVSIEAPFLGNMEGSSLLSNFEIKSYTNIYVEMPRISLHMGPVGETGGVSLAGTFCEKRIVYISSFLGSRGN